MSAASDALASHLREVTGLACAALIVEDDRQARVEYVLADIETARNGFANSRHWRKATAAIVDAWAGGDEAAVLAAFAAWERAGCEGCAESAANKAGDRCESCRPEVTA